MNRPRVACDMCGELHVAGNGLSIHRRIMHNAAPQTDVPGPVDDLYAAGYDDGYTRALLDITAEVDRIPTPGRGAVQELVTRLRYRYDKALAP